MISLQGLSKRYGSALAVDRLSVEVRSGLVTAFLGPNGSGKSTTMRMIVGIERPSAGRALVGGRSYGALRRPLLAVGALLDAGAVDGGRRAVDHLRWVAATNRIPIRRVGDVLSLVGLEAASGKRVRTFSLGMRQRLGIACALLGDPRIVIFDEPTNGLDLEGIHWMRALLRSLADEGRTVLVSSHAIGEMSLLADRLVIIGRGRLLADVAARAFVDACAGTGFLVRSSRSDELAVILRARGGEVVRGPEGALAVIGLTPQQISDGAATRRIVVDALTRRTGSLEDAYLDLTRESVEFEGRSRGTAS